MEIEEVGFPGQPEDEVRRPLAYFITFTTYGSHMIGDESGSVDRRHNQFGTPFVSASKRREERARQRMKESVYRLNKRTRVVVRKAMLRACERYGWEPIAIHVRVFHVHVVVSADADPDTVLNAFKTFATYALSRSRLETPRKKRWTENGSKRWVWTQEQLDAVIDYVLNRQGEPMEVWVDDDIYRTLSRADREWLKIDDAQGPEACETT